ncbi:hypothetical protein O8C79_06105 [Aliarcobacter butzleri]|uniref:hypothetical protein n=1 Tax=Aliarcobacter butzleri TaxID=28197 RepID=UPI00263E6511|nr:hypothetical protein [Aliarcobacter butzleri]MDN5104863.1 hypothetical protein [Aliarcobacter butzleri]
MKNILKILIFFYFINNLYGDSKFLYPVYSVKLDSINSEIIEMVINSKEELVIKHHFTQKEGNITIPPQRYEYTLNLNNLLLFQKNTNADYKYSLLGKIIIDKNNKLKYEILENIYNDIYYKRIERKKQELKRNIEYINQNNFTIEEIIKILDVDLLNEDLGEKKYSNKQYELSVKEATNNLVNCRFCEQILNLQFIESLYSAKIIYNNITSDFMSRKDFFNFFKKIAEKGNIYKQLDSKYISKMTPEQKLTFELLMLKKSTNTNINESPINLLDKVETVDNTIELYEDIKKYKE